MLGKTGRRKVRPGSGFHRVSPASAPASEHKAVYRLMFLLGFALLVAAITKPPPSRVRVSDRDIESQSIAQDTYRAEFFFETEDLRATKEKRDQAAAAEPDRYRVDRERVRRQVEHLDQQIKTLLAQRKPLEDVIREALIQSDPAEAAEDIVAKVVNDFAAQLRSGSDFESYPDPAALAVWLTPTEASVPERVFAERDSMDNPAVSDESRSVISLRDSEETGLQFAYADQLTNLAEDGLEYVLTHGVITSGLSKRSADQPIVILREDPLDDQKVTDEMVLRDVPDLTAAQQILRTRIVEKAKLLASVAAADTVDWAKLQGAAFDMAKTDITDTLFFDRVYSEGAREHARAIIEPVMKEIQPGEVLQRAGERWTEQSRHDVRASWQELDTGRKPSARILGALFSHMVFVGLALTCLHKSIPFLVSKKRIKAIGLSQDTVRQAALSLLLMCSMLVVGRVASYFEPSGLVLPLTSVGILLAILVHARLAVMVSFLTAGLVSIQYGYDWRLLVVGTAMSLAGVFSIFMVRRRSDMTRASVNATLVGLLAALAVTAAADSLFTEAALHRLALIGLNGAACLLIVPGLLAPLERLFGITTDIQLLEYSDLNNEVLGRLAIEVPATYAHSLMLGQLAEAAADAIGANGLLARVCAYYHDIGKLRRPEYFSENQTDTNIHDDLSPRLSARAIAAHVSQGVEMAREFHLPTPIVNGIMEHHGTSLVSFFYHEAVKQQKHGDVREEDFRYPGPKPQSRETGILMICDAVESGVRSIKNPNEERVREFVDKIIAGRSADRQFDECDLTLKELDLIGDVIARRVISTMHTRVAYPDTIRGETHAKNVIPLSGGAE